MALLGTALMSPLGLVILILAVIAAVATILVCAACAVGSGTDAHLGE